MSGPCEPLEGWAVRKALGEGRLVGRSPGYVLTVDPAEVDASRFDDLVREAKKTLGVDPSVAVTASNPRPAISLKQLLEAADSANLELQMGAEVRSPA